MENPKIIKSFILVALFILFGILFWMGLADIYLYGNFSASSFVLLTIFLLVFVILFLFLSLLLENRRMVLLSYLFVLLGFFIFFRFNYWLVIGLAVVFVAFVLSRTLIQKERKNRLRISLRRVFGRGLPWTLTLLALFIGLVSYFHPPILIEEDEIILPSQVSTWLIKPLAGTLSKVLPIIDKKTTVDEALSLTLATERTDLFSFSPELLKELKEISIEDLDLKDLIKNPKVAETFKQEVIEQAEKINPELLIQQRDELAKTFGISLTGKETISDLINKTINAKIKEAIGSAAGALPIISVVLTFIGLRLFFIPFGWLAILLSLLIFHFLRFLKFVKIEKVMKEGEDVSF